MGTHWNEKIPLKIKERHLLIDVIVGSDENTNSESNPPRQPGIRPDKSPNIPGDLRWYKTTDFLFRNL